MANTTPEPAQNNNFNLFLQALGAAAGAALLGYGASVALPRIVAAVSEPGATLAQRTDTTRKASVGSCIAQAVVLGVAAATQASKRPALAGGLAAVGALHVASAASMQTSGVPYVQMGAMPPAAGLPAAQTRPGQRTMR